MPGLTFNNSNWPEILKLLRFDSLCMAVGTPLFYLISILMGGYQLFDNIKLYALWIVILISIGAVYYIGKSTSKSCLTFFISIGAVYYIGKSTSKSCLTFFVK